MHACIMGKVITISEDAYYVLSKHRAPKESFSKIILRTFGEKNKISIMELAGAWKNSPETVKIMKEIYNERKNFKMRDIKFD